MTHNYNLHALLHPILRGQTYYSCLGFREAITVNSLTNSQSTFKSVCRSFPRQKRLMTPY